MTLSPTVLSPWVSRVAQFQKLYLVNKAVLDIVAIDIPVIGLAKNETERKERLFRQSLQMLVFFGLAPLHGRLFAHEAARRYLPKAFKASMARLNLLPSQLLQVPSSVLKNQAVFRREFPRLFQQTFQRPLPQRMHYILTEANRAALARAKTNFLIWDMCVQGLFLTSMGAIKNMFSKLFLSQSDRFSGEVGLVSDEKLRQIYANESWSKQVVKKWRTIAASALGVVVPLGVGLALKQALLPKTMPSLGLLKWLRNKAHYFDYNYPRSTSRLLRTTPLISLVPFAVVGYLNDVGDTINSRSPREARENSLKFVISTMFLFGDEIWTRVLAPFSGKNNPVPYRLRNSVEKTVSWLTERQKAGRQKLSKAVIQRYANRAAWSYLASFALTTASVSGIIMAMNVMTRRGVREKAAALSPRGSL